MKPSELNDDNSLVGATRNGHSLPVYDDSYGKLFIHRDSMGISGIVRARTWEDAYGICEDEFFPEADKTVDELRKEYNFTRKHERVVWDATIGKERYSVFPQDYAGGVNFDHVKFLRWETVTTPAEDENAWAGNELFQEAYGFRPNGPRTKDTIGYGIYSKDLNGDRLDELTDALAAELGIELTIETPE